MLCRIYEISDRRLTQPGGVNLNPLTSTHRYTENEMTLMRYKLITGARILMCYMVQVYKEKFAAILFFFFLNFCWAHVHFWGHWYPCFGLLLTSPLGFKARVGSALFELCGGVCDICSLRFTSGVTPLPVYIASIAAGHFPDMRVSAEVGCQIWTIDLLLGKRAH